MGYLIKNGYLIITTEERCKDLRLLEEVGSLRFHFPDFMKLFILEVTQHLCRKFPEYIFNIRCESASSKENIEWDNYLFNRELDCDYIYNYGANFVEKYHNKFVIEVWKHKKYIVGTEQKGKPTYAGFTLVPDGSNYKFIELESCYMSTEEKKNVRWWD